MLTAAFLILLTLTVGPFVFGFLRGLAGHKASSTSTAAPHEVDANAEFMKEYDEYLDDYWHGMLLEKPYQ